MLKLLSYPRAIVATIIAIFWTFFWSVFGLLGSYIFFWNIRGYQDWVLPVWGRFLMWMFNIDITIKGLENLSPDGVLFVFNHTSLFDIPIFHASIEKHTRFGAKSELYKIPFFGRAMTKFGALPIARADREKVFRLYDASVKRVHQGESFILAAEGGRHSGRGVGEKFKAGPFIFAITGQFPVQPIVIFGASDLLPNKAWAPGWGRWHNPVTLTILPIVPTKGLTLDDREKLKNSVHEMMTKAHAQS